MTIHVWTQVLKNNFWNILEIVFDMWYSEGMTVRRLFKSMGFENQNKKKTQRTAIRCVFFISASFQSDRLPLSFASQHAEETACNKARKDWQQESVNCKEKSSPAASIHFYMEWRKPGCLCYWLYAASFAAVSADSVFFDITGYCAAIWYLSIFLLIRILRQIWRV